jgi:glycosyltransferase involved in cell wall biosynthesis
MKVLLSAYACEPGKGSEPGVGWHWAIEIARLGHEVHILTRPKSVVAIERGLAELDGLHLNIHIHDYDLPRWARWWHKNLRGIHLHYLLWQWGAYRHARKLHAQEGFDLVHHITFAVYRHPSFMGGLGIPFIFGPIGGGEHSPPALLRSAPWRARIYEFLRSVGNSVASIDPLVRSTFHCAALILCKTPETLAVVPQHEQAKCIFIQDVATDYDLLAESPSTGSETARFLFVGNLLHLKGIHLILRALRQVREDIPDAKLTIVGDGRDRAWLHGLARQLGIDHAVDWRGKLPRQEVMAIYGSHTAFVFPSLHDSGGTVVLEALSQGLPVICLDLGGPGAILPENCGFKIAARDRTEEQVVSALAAAMKQLACDSVLRRELAENALAAARVQTWKAVVGHAYEQVEKILVTG